MPHVDNTYSFFAGPDFEAVRAPPGPKHMSVEKKSSRMSCPELSLLHQDTTISIAIEEWTNDYSYGFFSSPTLNPEPINKPNSVVSIPKINEGKASANYDGYSFFGI